MNHRDTKETVQIRTGLYSTTIYEMELWTLANELDYTDEDYKEQLEHSGCMNCGLQRESVGLFSIKESALEHLEMISEEPFDEYREIYCAFIREKAMNCMMNPCDYIKEWTYVNGHLIDESLVRNYDEDENPFHGRPEEMIRFKEGDVVMVADRYGGHWGIVWGVPMTPEKVKAVNERFKRKFGVQGDKFSMMDWSDDQYTILINNDDYMVSHEHILAHHVLPAEHVPEFVRKTLEEGLKR